MGGFPISVNTCDHLSVTSCRTPSIFIVEVVSVAATVTVIDPSVGAI
jgi:hypothetical protein